MPSSIQGVFFDWGGVLCIDPSKGFVNYCAAEFKISPQQLEPIIRKHLPDFMLGLNEADFWNRVCTELSIPVIHYPLWGKALAAVYEPITEVITLGNKLAQLGYKVGVLSNTEPPSMEFHLQQGYDFCSVRVFSCACKLAKPNAEIYAYAAEQMGLAPEQCVLIDDRVENVHGAIHAKMHAILYQNYNGLIDELKSLLGIDL